jgi:hypothetical protein
VTTPLYRTSVPGTFSFIGYTGRSYSMSRVTEQSPDGGLVTHYSSIIIQPGKSYISYIKFDNSTAVITPGYNYLSGTITSTI